MIKTILFDLDGTIVDTNELIIQTFLHVLEGQTDELYTRENIAPHMGKPLIDQLRFFTGKEEVDHLMPVYFNFNISKHDEMVKEFPYVRTVISELHKHGIQMGIVTSKVRKTTDMGLKLCGLAPYMQTIVTIEDVSKPKPDPEGILRALRELGADPSTAMMVGDSQYDIEAAQNAGIISVGVAWSLKGQDFLGQFKPDYMLQDMRELYPLAGITEESLEKNG